MYVSCEIIWKYLNTNAWHRIAMVIDTFIFPYNIYNILIDVFFFLYTQIGDRKFKLEFIYLDINIMF